MLEIREVAKKLSSNLWKALNIICGKTYKNKWVLKKSRKLPVTMSSLDVNVRKRGHIMSFVLLFFKLSPVNAKKPQ